MRSVDELRRSWHVLLGASIDVASNLVVKTEAAYQANVRRIERMRSVNLNTAYLEQTANQLEMQLQRNRAWLQFPRDKNSNVEGPRGGR